MNNIKQALESAIEILTRIHEEDGIYYGAVEQCKAALAELEKCEPVKGVIISEGSPTLLSDKYIKATDIRLYTSPPQQQWVGLSDDDIVNIGMQNFTDKRFARAIETKCKQLNTKG